MATTTDSIGLDPLLTEKQYCAYIGIGSATAKRQRANGTGPRYVQLSTRRIAYRLSDVQHWLEMHARGDYPLGNPT